MKNTSLLIIIAILGLVIALAVAGYALVALNRSGQTANLTGMVTYFQQISLPEDAVVTVQIQDVSRADAPAVIVGEQVLSSPGQPPIPFEIPYNPTQIEESHRYIVRAEIRDNAGVLLFTTDTAISVLTEGNPSENVEIIVVPVEG
jgi:putative lipoprotein